MALLVPATVVTAGATKFSFNDVTFSDGTTGEIEASSKDGKKSDFTTCSYYSDDYAEYLGYYESDEFASTEADEVKEFCLDNFEERDPH